ncbi:NUDIX hydrolase [Thalassobacillus hwangdonensis]|uniref:NUDIX domain-containing protein n=1 Tax=Thalassobacillus hwangdonensis TaxID=546108 RepID=A0ABW3L0V5_9BACI
MFKYTICLIKKDNKILLLNRNKKPAMGMWNGVGGKIEDHETPMQGVIRETYEETGLKLNSVTYAGNVILKSEVSNAGMYIFIADLPEDLHIETPLNTLEGTLDWKSIDWILDKDNMGVISNLKSYLPVILEGKLNLEHSFTYDIHNILDYTTTKVIENEMNKRYKKHQYL